MCVCVCCVGCLCVCVCPKRFHPKSQDVFIQKIRFHQKKTFIRRHSRPRSFNINFSGEGPKGGGEVGRATIRVLGVLFDFWLFLKAGDPQRCLFGLSACPEFWPFPPSLPPTPFGPSPHRKKTEHGQEQEGFSKTNLSEAVWRTITRGPPPGSWQRLQEPTSCSCPCSIFFPMVGARISGLHDSPRAHTGTFEFPAPQKHHQNSTRRPPRKGKKEWNLW